MNGGIKEEFSNAWSKPNNAVVQIILINLIVFVAARVFKVFFDLSGATESFFWIFRKLQLPADIGTLLLQPWSLVTYFFTHFDFFHILFNMLFLFWFGRIIQEFLNSKRVISLYVLGGLAGGLLYIFIYNFLPFYADRVTDSMMLGASAGVYAIVVGAAVFMPNYTFFLIFIGPVKIKYIAIFYVFMSFIGTTGANAGGEIAHLGGALVGWLYISQLNKGSDMGGWVINFIHFVKSLFKPQPKIKVTHRSGNRRPSGAKKKAGASKATDQTPQSEIDAILDKISESGYESLTKDEKQKLFNASKK
ncbi:rhomboid family intramembrane serine protease [Ekhidna sp.]|uniref:rhomboid family intramembrane serine protease n=1 Tax=Ekhidna sp. TaxID=2608089 RepID=UPI003C7E4724